MLGCFCPDSQNPSKQHLSPFMKMVCDEFRAAKMRDGHLLDDLFPQ